MEYRGLLVLIASFLMLTGCIAPLARTSEVGHGFGFEGGGGASVYRGRVILKDTSVWWGGRSVMRDVNAGLFAAGRISYGHKDKYGGDLTLAGGWGAPLKAGDDWGGWLHIVLGGKYRPWKTNNLFFAELGYPQLGVGWVGGFPMTGPERWSLMLKTGSGIPADILTRFTQDELELILQELIPPTMLQVNIAHHIRGRRRRYRVTPQFGFGLGFEWSPFKTAVSNILAGVTFSP